MSKPQAPSPVLIPLKRLSSFKASQIEPLAKLLREIYQPEVRGTSPTAEDSGYASEVSENDSDTSQSSTGGLTWNSLRRDRFERSVAMKWLTGLVSRGEEWVGEAEQEKEQEDRMAIVDDAAVLLSSCAGTSTGPLMRPFEFPTDGEPIVIYLRDASILSQDHTSVGLQTWGSCCILANRMARHPEEYGLQKESLSSKDGRIDSTNASSSPLRVLELGAGTGLLSMVVAKMLAPTAEVFATDFHPAVLDNLQANVSGNFTGPPEELVQCVPQVLPLDWQSFHAMRSAQDNGSRTSLDSPFNQTFDIIIGADIIYEPTHAHWIKSTVEMTLRKPSGVCRHVPGGCFHLIMPARPTHDEETASVPAAFPSADSIRQTRQSGGTTDLQLGIVSMDELDRVAGTGRSDEVHYILYRIEWV